ncbi:MAG: histidinol-phosphate transaminase [Gammaproteobacteria bacterium]
MKTTIEQYAATGVQALQPYLPGKPISELEREYGVKDIIKLASNENPLGPSPSVVSAIQSALPDLSRYPDGNGFALKASLSDKLDVPIDWITLGNGSNDVLDLVARVFLSPGTEAIYSQYAFAVYPIVTQAVGATGRVSAAHDGSRGPAWGHDLEAMLALVSNATRVIFIANPNNPTGTWLKRNELHDFLLQIPDHVVVVIDEAYFEYIEEVEYPNAMRWVDEFSNLLVTRTFSKAYGLAALRIGYAVSQPAIADLLNRVRQPFNANHLALTAARAALSDADHLQRSIMQNRRSLAFFEAELNRLSLNYIPSAGNFICVDVGKQSAEIYEKLLREAVIVRPVANYNMPHHLRVSTGLDAENCRFMDALGQVLA